MRSPPQRLVEGRDGPPRLVRGINDVREYAISKSILRVNGGRVRETSGGTSITIDEAQVSEGGAGLSQRMLVTAIYGDYYVCSGPDGAVQVAKPWRLRRTPFDGQTISFTDEQSRTYSAAYTYDGIDETTPSVRRSVEIVSAGTATFSESQVVIPRLKVSFDYIDVMESENGTGVSGVDLIDLNTDGRAWARER